MSGSNNLNQIRSHSLSATIKSMIERGKDGVINMPSGIAGRIISECSFIGQRKVKQNRVKTHIDRIEIGNWRGSAHPITFAEVAGSENLVLVNGHHRCEAIRQTQSAVQVRIVIVPVASEIEARRLYSEFDDPTSSRSIGEVLDAEQLPIAMGLGKDFTQRIFRAVTIIRCVFDIKSKADSENRIAQARDRALVIAEMPGWINEAHAYSKAIATARPGISAKFRTTGLIAVALYTLRYQPIKANDFWCGLARNDGLRAKDPRSALIDDFKVRNSGSGNIEQSMIAPAVAWNAFFDDRDLKIIKVAHALRIAGTPAADGVLSLRAAA